MLLYCLFLVSCSFSKTKFASVFLQERKYRGTEGSDLFFVLGGTRSLLAESWLLLLMSCLLDVRDKGLIVWVLLSVSIWKGLLINITSAKIALYSYVVFTRDTFTWDKSTFLLYCVAFSIVKWHLPQVNVSRVNTTLIISATCFLYNPHPPPTDFNCCILFIHYCGSNCCEVMIYFLLSLSYSTTATSP